MRPIVLANRSQRVPQNAAAKLAEAEAAATAGEGQANSSEARKVSADDAQADLDEEIAKMISEGGPTY